MEPLFCFSFRFSVRNPEGRIRLYCKGADIVLFERLHPCNQELMSITSDHLNVSSRGDVRSCAATCWRQTASRAAAFSRRDHVCRSACVNTHLCWPPGVCGGWIAHPGAGLQGPGGGRVGVVV